MVASLTSRRSLYTQSRFAMMRGSVGVRLVNYLHQPYGWFLNRHGADLGKTILSEVSIVVQSGIIPMLTLIAQSAVTLALLILLVIVDPILSLSVGVVLGLAYSGIIAVVSSRLRHLGQTRTAANQERFKVVGEAFGAAKEVKVGGHEPAYIQRFSKPAEIYASKPAQIISQLRASPLEAIALGACCWSFFILWLRAIVLPRYTPSCCSMRLLVIV